MQYSQMNHSQLEEEYARTKAAYEAFCTLGLSLNLARGKPSAEQLDLSNAMLHTLDDESFVCDGFDVRNYGWMGCRPARRCLRTFWAFARRTWSSAGMLA